MSFDGSCALWEPEVPGEIEAAGEEAAAVAEQRQAASGKRAVRTSGRHSLPAAGRDQYVW